jgi:hypothetical protein
MKNFDLESKMKSLRVPERGEEYWEAFPQRVLDGSRAVPAEQPAPRSVMPGLFCIGRVALACLLLGFCLWQSRMPRALSHVLRKDEKELRQSVERLNRNLGTLMQDEHGLDSLIKDPS